MPWWVWLLIWAALVLTLAGMLGFFARRLFGILMAVLFELGAPAETAGLPDAATDDLDERHHELAVLAKFADLKRRQEQVRAAWRRRRRVRTQTRLSRAKMITSADATQRKWPNVR